MKIDPNRLRTLRQRKKLSRPDLERISGITVRTIQRLENEPDECKTTREDTVIRLAKALEIEPGVLAGELPLPEPNEAPASEPDPVRIGAQIPPKVRLAYDLIKRRYGVNATDVITMAPLFFTLLAAGSLAWRREKSEEAWEAFLRLEDIEGYWRGSYVSAYSTMEFGAVAEDDSIENSDLFGNELLDSSPGTLLDDGFFDPTCENPFATYLRKLATDLGIPGIVDVDGGELDFGLEFRFPYYDVCGDELDKIANASAIGRAALEMGFLRLSEIPKELMAKDKEEDRQQWLEDRMSAKFEGLKKEKLKKFFKALTILAHVSPKTKELLEEHESRNNIPETEKKGDDQ